MLQSNTKKQIKSHKWNKLSNKSQFFKRIREQSDSALYDLTLLAENLDEEQLKEIFTIEKLEPLVRALMKIKKNNKDRVFFTGYTFLKWSLNTTSATLNNRWAKELYSQHEAPLREMLEMLHHERKQKLKS